MTMGSHFSFSFPAPIFWGLFPPFYFTLYLHCLPGAPAMFWPLSRKIFVMEELWDPGASSLGKKRGKPRPFEYKSLLWTMTAGIVNFWCGQYHTRTFANVMWFPTNPSPVPSLSLTLLEGSVQKFITKLELPLVTFTILHK
ncbi:hypothetical protein HOY80DRAFT_938015 [Tuber brumale]|nr:hypothetical protein HOY80DRAFT_938015 [Tuber brumale]